MRLDYVREPEAIYEASFRQIAVLPELQGVPEPLCALATRLVHTCGMADVVADLRASADLSVRFETALRGGAAIFCDTDTVRHGIMRRLLPGGCELHCDVHAPFVAVHAERCAMTRSAAQFELWGERLNGQVVAIGNAPTALFRLLELMDEGVARPAAILAFPVGFVGAAESKAELVRDPRGAAYATVLGRRGGAGMAQAAVNALAGGLGR